MRGDGLREYTFETLDSEAADALFCNLRFSLRPAGIIRCGERGMLFVAASRLGATWLLRELIPQGLGECVDWDSLALAA